MFAALALSAVFLARPTAPAIVCEVYGCNAAPPSCTLCHLAAPELNAYGADVMRALAPGVFEAGLPGALAAVEKLDSDLDGIPNLDELLAGSLPGDVTSRPPAPEDEEETPIDWARTLKKVSLDFCGYSPSFEAMQNASREACGALLEECLKSAFWRGKDGVLWQIAHEKIRPIGVLKVGEDGSTRGVADYYDDYHLFVWTQIDDHDAREVLTADYYVVRHEDPLRYEKVDDLDGQTIQRDRRVGMLSTRWFRYDFIMVTPLPRGAAAHAYRAYLGLDIARYEGLVSITGEPVDYDGAGVGAQACAACHATLDPLTYPFSPYHGADGDSYDPARAPEFPERGAIFGRPVDDLVAWTEVAVNSDAFAAATVTDYWKVLFGRPPALEERGEYEHLWRKFREEHGYRVEVMLRDLIFTEAYLVRE